MAKSAKERQAERAGRLRGSGYKPRQLWLSTAARAALVRIRERTGLENQEIVSRALILFEQVVGVKTHESILAQPETANPNRVMVDTHVERGPDAVVLEWLSRWFLAGGAGVATAYKEACKAGLPYTSSQDEWFAAYARLERKLEEALSTSSSV